MTKRDSPEPQITTSLASLFQFVRQTSSSLLPLLLQQAQRPKSNQKCKASTPAQRFLKISVPSATFLLYPDILESLAKYPRLRDRRCTIAAVIAHYLLESTLSDRVTDWRTFIIAPYNSYLRSDFARGSLKAAPSERVRNRISS